MSPKKPNKGFQRTKKEWETSIAGHFGRLIDRFSFDDILTMGIGASAGLKFGSWEAAITAMIGYKLARAPGATPPVSQIAGCGILGTLGLLSLLHTNYSWEPIPGVKIPQAIMTPDEAIQRIKEKGEIGPPVVAIP